MAAARIDERLDDLLLNPCRAVACQFHHVFAREGVGGTKDGEHRLIEDVALGIGELPQVDRVRCHVGQWFALPALLHNIERLCSTHADHSNAAPTLRGRDGADGVTYQTG